jgi:hypothetical protein
MVKTTIPNIFLNNEPTMPKTRVIKKTTSPMSKKCASSCKFGRDIGIIESIFIMNLTILLGINLSKWEPSTIQLSATQNNKLMCITSIIATRYTSIMFVIQDILDDDI